MSCGTKRRGCGSTTTWRITNRGIHSTPRILPHCTRRATIGIFEYCTPCLPWNICSHRTSTVSSVSLHNRGIKAAVSGRHLGGRMLLFIQLFNFPAEKRIHLFHLNFRRAQFWRIFYLKVIPIRIKSNGIEIRGETLAPLVRWLVGSGAFIIRGIYSIIKCHSSWPTQ